MRTVATFDVPWRSRTPRRNSFASEARFPGVRRSRPYERAIKNRPSVFEIDLQIRDTVGIARISINAVSLMHRACGELPHPQYP